MPDRRAYALSVAQQLVVSGKALSAFGLALHTRGALAIVTQSAGELASGIVNLMDVKNQYAAAALLRQFIEAEYLIWLFGEDPAEGEAWLGATTEAERARFRPAKLRKRAAGKFADTEYWTHCEVGGHPHPRASPLLPDRNVTADAARQQALESLLWLEIAVHFQRLWAALQWTLDELELHQNLMVNEANVAVREAEMRWSARDADGQAAVKRLVASAENTAG